MLLNPIRYYGLLILKWLRFFRGCIETLSPQNTWAPSIWSLLDFASFSNLPHWSSSSKAGNTWWSEAFRGVFTKQNEIFTKTNVLNMKKIHIHHPSSSKCFWPNNFPKCPANPWKTTRDCLHCQGSQFWMNGKQTPNVHELFWTAWH